MFCLWIFFIYQLFTVNCFLSLLELEAHWCSPCCDLPKFHNGVKWVITDIKWHKPSTLLQVQDSGFRILIYNPFFWSVIGNRSFNDLSDRLSTARPNSEMTFLRYMLAALPEVSGSLIPDWFLQNLPKQRHTLVVIQIRDLDPCFCNFIFFFLKQQVTLSQSSIW